MATFRPSNRSALLDCIRAGAIIMVLVFHVATRYDTAELDAVAKWFMKYGFLGVDVFYPLSGFLITRFLVERSGPGHIRTFFLRRVFRIIPLYFVAVTVYLIASKVLGYEEELADKIWINYLFLTGWFIFFEGVDQIPFRITWSLSVEEFAYIAFGLFAWFSKKRFNAFLIALAVLPIGLRIYLNFRGFDDIYYLPLARLDSIALGGLTAVMIRKKLPVLPILIAALIFVVLVGQSGEILRKSHFFTLVTLATCIFIALFETRFKGFKSLPTDMLGKLGFYSYFIYLFHFFNLYALTILAERLVPGGIQFWAMTLLCLAVTLIQAIISFRIFEGPLLAYGRTLETQRPAAVVEK
ncbi:acyltransferase family protein [Actibacterium lipolyticum]|nr:acyltransferase [Actibacterium lipolyticum]